MIESSWAKSSRLKILALQIKSPGFKCFAIPIKAKMPGPLAYFGSVVKNGEVYVVGGISGFRNTDETGQLRVYSPSRDAWANIQPPMSVLNGKVSAVLASDL